MIDKEGRLFDGVEYILCSAILFDDGKKYNYQPTNIESGLVICAWKHACVFPIIGGTVGSRQELGIYEKEQGFLTSRNRFVGREEAGQIALACGQIKKMNYFGGKKLDSSDLY